MRDTCTDHFEPLRFDRVGSRSQGRSKYGAMWGKWGQFWAIFCPYHTPPFLILTCGTQSCCTLRYLSINVMFERLRGKAAFPLVAMVFKSTAAPTVHTRHRCQLFPPVNSSQSNLYGELIHYMSIKPTDTRMDGFSRMYCCCCGCC